MRLLLPTLLPVALLAGCTGYVADYWRPKTAILGPELSRFGLEANQSRCVGEKLAGTLSVWQLRQLARSAGAVPERPTGPLTLQDLLWVASHAEDARLRQELVRAAEACGLGAEATRPTENAATPPAPLAAQDPPARSGPAPEMWINLGAARTGQSIAVDASTIEAGPSYRSAWFRLTNPGAAGRSANSYLLRIDCAARTITPMQFRKIGADGAVAEHRDYGPNGEARLQVETGTVMEIAYLSLCT